MSAKNDIEGEMHYQAPFWLPGGHLQTIYPTKWVQRPPVSYRRERWTSPDRDFIDIDFVDGPPGAPLVVLFHGLEGSSRSHYSRALMHAVASNGWSGAVPHFRTCSGELNLQPRFYHSGDAQEIDWIARKLRAGHSGTLYLCGVSLGANAMLRWLGESGSQANFVQAACAISAPLDLTQSSAALGRGMNMIYTRAFLQTLKLKCIEKLHQFPGLFDRERMLQAKNLRDFDDAVTAPLHGYASGEDYWNRASSKHVLGEITVPTLVLNARNDPFLPAKFLPRQAAPAVTLEYPARGGHVGFVTGKMPGKIDWLPQRILSFLSGSHAG